MKGTAFITGATSGFGDAIARRLSKEGYKIIAIGRRIDRLKKLAQELKNTHIIECDIRDKDAVFEAVKNIPESYRDIEILVNNAGLALGVEGILQTNVEDLETMVDTNIKGLLYSTKAILPIMAARKSGYVFNLGSTAGAWPYPGSHVYGASKAFVKQFSRNIRNDLKGSGIRVTEIAPGICKTEFSEVRFKGDIERANEVYAGFEPITSQDIATIVVNCINMPKHVNINVIELMATAQTWAGLHVEKN
ncbi:SDR family NAD(P)-dependent oxidoreductase [Campylobacter sp. RM16192]|uniref:SDR family NAD(P)-dependent oxidoreductase n=1 Tax=Campylobacter sp. RM16192 TaxID=1660080 RepID=UPI001452067D|nr:SDR family NAD(P)-dependent oxidoreductase [Campylobacter sp. RM16192]QCD52468.1 short-chain dehydrogenase/reductase, subgroup 5 [Campylobacter sp. RM16192]